MRQHTHTQKSLEHIEYPIGHSFTHPSFIYLYRTLIVERLLNELQAPQTESCSAWKMIARILWWILLPFRVHRIRYIVILVADKTFFFHLTQHNEIKRSYADDDNTHTHNSYHWNFETPNEETVQNENEKKNIYEQTQRNRCIICLVSFCWFGSFASFVLLI